MCFAAGCKLGGGARGERAADGNAVAGDAAVDAPTDYGNTCRPSFANYTAVEGSNANCHVGCNRPLGGFAVRVWLCDCTAAAAGATVAGDSAGTCQCQRRSAAAGRGTGGWAGRRKPRDPFKRQAGFG